MDKIHSRTASASLVRASLIGVARQNIDPATVLSRAGVGPELLSDDKQRTDLASFARIFRAAWDSTGCETGGFLQRPMPLGSFAMICHATITCPNLRRVLLRASRFYRLLGDELSLDLQEHGDEAKIVVHHDNRHALDTRAFMATLMVAWLRWFSWLINREILPDRVHFAGAKPDYLYDIQQMFPCDHYFDQPQTALIMPARYVNLAVQRDPQALNEFLVGAPEGLMYRYRSEDSLSHKVKQALRSSEALETLSLEEAASGLALSTQTLRRRLREEGNGFQELKDSERHQRAVNFLLYSNLTVNEIAAQLGFSEPSAFHRAFKKWTGFAPGQYRLQHSH